jgi:beta-barrel assembly-enhancing protease
MKIGGTFFDGEIARDKVVSVRRIDDAVEFIGDDTPLTRWTINGMHPIDPPQAGQPFRITHDDKPGSRLVIRDDAFIAELVAANKHLKGGYSFRHIGQVFGWTVAGLASFAALGWLAMTFLPGQLAGLLPDRMRNEAGTQVVNSLVGSSKKCENPAGKEALALMVAALAEGKSELPPLSVEVYDLPIMNAFAAPGGRVVFTNELIQKADTPEEVIGVFAHEVGHVALLHPEQQLVRIAGMQVLIAALTGGGVGEYLGNIAGIASILRHSREAEREADAFARDIMNSAAVDPTGLKTFFEKVMKLEKPTEPPKDANAAEPSSLEKFGNIFSTHPDTEERIKAIAPLPAGVTPVKVMTDAQWQALRGICK